MSSIIIEVLVVALDSDVLTFLCLQVKDSSSVKCAPGNSFKAEKLTIGKRKSISSFNGAADSIKNHARASLSLAKKEKIRGTIKILDNNWAEKQTESFTEWMNYTFLQSESDQSEELEESQALSNNELYSPALCQLLQKRADAKHRQQAMLLYKAEEVSFAIQLLNFEVDEDRLIVREDRDVFADLGLHEVLFGLLFSYELSWLKLALETVFNTPITLQGKTKEGTLVEQRLSRSSVKWKQLLKNFLTQHLLSNDQILSQFPKQKLLYAVQEKKMKVLLRKHFAKSFLAIIKFLDAARLRQLLPLSTLFRKDSTVKSSRDVVCEFCRSFLHGEGDIIRHLSLIHYHVQFEQSYVDEFDYKVSNLALDLRDGVRLARLVETLKKSYELSPQLRVPAVSRLQKLHNVSIVLKTLYSNSEKAPDAKHIIDGHRDITLLLLWKIMYSFELRMMINEQKVYEEVQAIEQNGWRRSLYNEDDAVGLAVQVPIKCKDGSLRLPTSIKHDPEASADSNDTESNAAFCAIIRWCQAIAWHYEVPVYNLTSCLADGRVLCLLVHYYHPSILPVKHIRKTTANFLDNSLSKTSLDEFMDKSSLTKSELQQGLSGEQRNFITLKRACACIGGIPMILPNIDSRNIPEEKTMVVFLGYLFGRLIESSAQVRASIRIQRAFRNSLQFLRKNSKIRMTETTIIAEASCRMRSNSATMSMPVKILLSADKAAAMIQKWFVSQRTRSILKKRIADKAIAVAAKSQERLVTEKTEVELVSQTVGDEDTMSLVDQLKEQVQKELEARLEQERLLLQSMESKREEEARIHEEFQIQQALEKQRIEQENCEREIREQEAKVVAQMKYEAEEALEKAKQRVLELENTLLLDRQSSAVIERRKLELEQALAEEVARRQEFMDLIEKEEDHLREEHQARLLSEEEVKNERKARALAEERLQEEAVARQQAEERLRQIEEERLLEKLQVQKAFEEKQRLKALQRASALAIQSRWRCKRAQLHFAKRIRYVIVIQSLFRRSVAQKRANCAILAILLLQAYWRRKLCFKEIALQDRSARVLQQWIKAKACRRHYLMLKSSIRKLMSTWLMHKHVKHLIKLKIVALHCQRLVRGFCDRRKAQKRLTSILKIQKNARFFLSTLMLQKQNKSASVIQKSWRVFLNLKIKQSRMQGNLVKQFVMNRSSKRIVSIFRNNLVWKLRNYAVLSITRWYISKRILLRAKKLCKGFRRLAVSGAS